MAIQIQLRKGTATEHDTFTGADGEVTVDTTNKTLRVHDGSTVGGTILTTLTANRDFGVGQSWQNVTASRASGTTYVNTTGKPISVVISGYPTGLSERLVLIIGGIIVWDQNVYDENGYTNVVVSGVVPPNYAYAVNAGGHNTTISRWVELR